MSVAVASPASKVTGCSRYSSPSEILLRNSEPGMVSGFVTDPSRVSVNVTEPPSSTDASVLSIVTHGTSFSVNVSVAPVNVSVAPVDVSVNGTPLTMMVSSSSNASSSIAFRVNVPAPERSLARIVTGKSATAAKSVPSVAVPPARDTITAVGLSRVLLWGSIVAVTVTVCAPPSSPTDSGFSVNFATRSSSSIVSVVPITGTPAARVVPLTRTSLSSVCRSLLTAVIVTVPVPAVALAGKSSQLWSLTMKSALAAGATASGATVTRTSWLNGGSIVAVTVADPPSSPMRDGVTASVTIALTNRTV